mgnify:CR=1 FL=1
MLNQVIEYAKISIISLEQDLEKLNEEASLIWDDGNEIEEVSLNGQIMGIRQILNYCQELTNPVTKEYNLAL